MKIDEWGFNAEAGGDGGDGGDAGLGCFAAEPVVVKESFTIESLTTIKCMFNMVSGSGGKGGDGGKGGVNLIGNADDGDPGKRGNGFSLSDVLFGQYTFTYVKPDFEGVIITGNYDLVETPYTEILK